MTDQSNSAGRIPHEVPIAVVLLVVLLLLRLWDLDADPPDDLSASTSVYTDHSQYTLYARNFVETGEFNPFGDYRQPFFLRSCVTPLAAVVFSAFGVGLWQSNLVGLLMAWACLVLVWLAVRRMISPLAGLLTIVMAGINTNLFFYGRLPFLEHAMCFWAFLALVVLLFRSGHWWYLAAGASLAIGVFFGKVIGLIFLFPFAAFLFYRHRFEIGGEPRPWYRPVWFVAGFGLIALAWYLFGFLTTAEQVTGYIGEQAYDLYGAPDGLSSIDGFLAKLASFGDSSKLFERLIAPALFGTVLILVFLYRLAGRGWWKQGLAKLSSGHVFIVAAIVAFYGSLMIWNYRPLRYQLVLIYLFCAAAATVPDLLIARRTANEPTRAWLFGLLSLPLAFVLTLKLIPSLAHEFGAEFNYGQNGTAAIIISVALSAVLGLAVSLKGQRQVPRLPYVALILAVVIALTAILPDMNRLVDWRSRVAFTLRDNSRDLALVVGDGAVVSGPYGPSMALEGQIPSVIHMFGPGQVDPRLFDRFPITHMLLDEANEGRAREGYCGVFDSAQHVCTYHIGLKKVRLYRLADGVRGNYRRSGVESAAAMLADNNLVATDSLIRRYLARMPENITGNLLLGSLAEVVMQMDTAEVYTKKAVEFSPTNYNLNASLAMLYKKRYDTDGDPDDRARGLESFRRATKLAPTVYKIRKAMYELEDAGIDQSN